MTGDSESNEAVVSIETAEYYRKVILRQIEGGDLEVQVESDG